MAGEELHPDGGRASFRALRPAGRLTPGQMAEWLARAAVFALPARYEPFGLSPLEAVLAGCALVLGDIPSLREVWGEAALFVPPADPAALRETLREVMRADLAARARKRALTYTPERRGRAYLELYHALRPSFRSRPRPQPAAGGAA